MKVYVALLRGINVGGHKKIKMAKLRSVLESSELQNVKTYIQSGNIVFQSNQNAASLSTFIHDKIYEEFGFEVPVIVIEKSQMESILENNPLSENKIPKSYYTVLKDKPSLNSSKEFEATTFPNEEFSLVNECVYYFTELGYGKSKYSNNLVENKLKVQASTRNHRTMIKLSDMANELS